MCRCTPTPVYKGAGIAFVAIAGLAALFVAAGTGAYFGSLYGPEHKQYQTVDQIQSGTSHYQGPSKTLSDIAGVPGMVERVIANPPPQSGKDHEKRDLAAQEAMAAWAFWMTLLAACTTIITAIGTFFIAKQIKLTRGAVQETVKATEAMEHQTEIARRSLEAQDRAWVNFDVSLLGASYGDNLFWIDLKLQFSNMGNSPANSVSYEIALATEHTPSDLILNSWRFFADTTSTHDTTLFPAKSGPKGREPS